MHMDSGGHAIFQMPPCSHLCHSKVPVFSSPGPRVLTPKHPGLQIEAEPAGPVGLQTSKAPFMRISVHYRSHQLCVIRQIVK